VAAFLANVGVNAGHAARSPLFDDGTFVLLPIPERTTWREPMLRLRDTDLEAHAPASWANRAIHLDPDLTSTVPTYGDNCRRAGRAFSLRRAQPGDLIVFLARLSDSTGRSGFHLVGSLDIEDVLEDLTREPGSGWWDANAHVRRARATNSWDSFWVFRGTSRSALFQRAIRFARSQTETLFTDASWPAHRTELQTIGSYTRAVRRVTGEAEDWLRTICLS
jgi:hypothetical protein